MTSKHTSKTVLKSDRSHKHEWPLTTTFFCKDNTMVSWCECGVLKVATLSREPRYYRPRKGKK